jgi:hypothetical protein
MRQVRSFAYHSVLASLSGSSPGTHLADQKGWLMGLMTKTSGWRGLPYSWRASRRNYPRCSRRTVSAV